MKQPASSPAPSAEEEVTQLGPVAAPQWGAVGQISGALAPVRSAGSQLPSFPAGSGGRERGAVPPAPAPAVPGIRCFTGETANRCARGAALALAGV